MPKVLQIAANEETFGLERLWDLCKTARALLDERAIRIGRVIARPFLGTSAADFKRTEDVVYGRKFGTALTMGTQGKLGDADAKDLVDRESSAVRFDEHLGKK